MDCKTCRENRLEPVPYLVHESAMARNERTVKRLLVVLAAVILLWFATIGVFVWYLNQYDFESYEEIETTTYQQDGEGINIIGNSNEVNGE